MSSIDLRLYEAIIKIEKIVSMSAKISIFFNIYLGLCLLDPRGITPICLNRIKEVSIVDALPDKEVRWACLLLQINGVKTSIYGRTSMTRRCTFVCILPFSYLHRTTTEFNQ